MILDKIHRPARRFLMERLERLHDALIALGQRLREGIAQLVGKHVGEAIRDAIESLLFNLPPAPAAPAGPAPQYSGYHDPYDYPHEGYPEEDFWQDREPMPEEPEPHQRPSRWRSLLTGLVQMATWSVQNNSKRPSLRKLLCIGAAVGIFTLVAGPVVGGIVMTVGTTILLTRLADGTTAAVGQLATATTP